MAQPRGYSSKVLRRGQLEYIAIYETAMLEPVQKHFIFKHVKFEIVSGPRTYTIAKLSTRTVTSGITPKMLEAPLDLYPDPKNKKTYLILTARTKIKDPEIARKF